jgi:hypothetical protein
MKNKFKFIGLTIFFSTLILANNNCIFAQENDTVDQQTTTLETDILFFQLLKQVLKLNIVIQYP